MQNLLHQELHAIKLVWILKSSKMKTGTSNHTPAGAAEGGLEGGEGGIAAEGTLSLGCVTSSAGNYSVKNAH